ncbi:MAG: hypothetical protein HKN26_05525, partial [Acidimicrobiales bacterium]|nr:hypothetical protein [Acidimicrobiales bacterium]
PTSAGRQIAHAMTAEQLFDTIGVRFRAEDFLAGVGVDRVDLQWNITDLDEHHVLSVGNAAISHHADQHADEPAATLTVTRSAVAMLLGKLTGFGAALESGELAVEGDSDVVASFFDHIDGFEFFALVEP